MPRKRRARPGWWPDSKVKWELGTAHGLYLLRPGCAPTHAYDLGFGTWDDSRLRVPKQYHSGLAYVLTPTHTIKVSPLPVQWAGDPDSNSNGYGVSFEGATYTHGRVCWALGASGTSDPGERWWPGLRQRWVAR